MLPDINFKLISPCADIRASADEKQVVTVQFEPVTLSCSVESSVPPCATTTYTWTRDGEVLFYQVSSSMNVSLNDQPDNSNRAIYECIATVSDPKLKGTMIDRMGIMQY